MTYRVWTTLRRQVSSPARLSLLFLALSPCVHAQRATLSGTVSDPKGGLLSGVELTLLNLDQGLKREATTNQEGAYYVPWLQPGQYVLTAQKEGFAIAEVKDLILHVGGSQTLH